MITQNMAPERLPNLFRQLADVIMWARYNAYFFVEQLYLQETVIIEDIKFHRYFPRVWVIIYEIDLKIECFSAHNICKQINK